MALLINNATPAGTDQKKFGDDEIRALKLAVQEIFGIPNNQTIAQAVMTINTSGQIASMQPILGKFRVGASATDTKVTTGAVFDQGDADDFIIVLKSVDVAQPMTDFFTAGTFAALGKAGALVGGLKLQGISDATGGVPSLHLEGLTSLPNSTKSNAAVPAVLVSGRRTDGGTGVTTLASTHNLFGVGNGDADVVLLVEANGSLRLRPGVSGVLPLASADDFIIEGQAASPVGLSILTPTNTQTARIVMGDPEDANSFELAYDHSDDSCAVAVGGVATLHMLPRRLFVAETANANMTNGITINGAAATNEHFTIKSNVNPHGFTSKTENDTYATVGYTAEDGGLQIRGFSNTDSGCYIIGNVETADTTKASAARAPMRVSGRKRSGTTDAAMGANENIFIADNWGLAKLIVDAEGDIHVDGSSSLATFDTYNDIELLTAARASLMPEGADFRKRYADWISRYAPVLAANKIVTYNEDGHHFTSYKGMQMLIIDTIRQLYERLLTVEARLA